MIGQLLAGRYRVVRVLGAGGFGETYVTEDLHLPGHPKCVLKHLKPASNDGKVLELARTLFEKEAIVLQQLGNHDRIPRLLAYFEEDREFYLVQEYIPGHPLSVELGRGKKWTDDRVINLLAEVLDILVFIHSQGVIHRDIKPDNIMRRDLDNKLVLIDFGAIKQVRNQPSLSGQPTMTIAIGTPGYMPIEQASGNPRPSSDIYALGAIGIQAVTGVDPSDLAEDEHTGERKWEHLAIANPQLIAILQRMTRYHFKDRYHTALEALQAVRALMAGTEPQNATYVQAPPSQSPNSYRPANIEELPTVAVAPPPRSSIASNTTTRSPQGARQRRSQPPRQPRPTPKSSKFPLFAGSLFLLAAAGSFAFFSSQVFDRRKFQTDLTSPELCRLAASTYLNGTKVRAEPDRDAKIIANLPRGTKVVYISERNPFVQIRYTDGVGWVFNDQISSCNPPVSSPTPTPSVAPTKSVPVKPSPSLAPPVKPSPTPIDTPTPTPSVTPSASPTPSLPPSPTPQPSNSPTPTPTPTPEYIPGITEPPSPPPEPSPESSPKSNEKLGDVPNPDKSAAPEDKTPLW
jgi:serine/threonine-protein kinase